MSSSDCIEMDDSFMFNVNMRRDRCLLDENSFRYPFDEKIHNSFQKILDLVKPLNEIRLCSDEDCEKYQFSYNKDIENTLDYEKCYTILLDQARGKITEEKVLFLAPYVPYLLAILNDFSAVEDAYAYDDRFRNNETIAFIIVYRYEHNISILNDLRLEQSIDEVCKYHVKVVERLYDEKYAKLEKMKEHNPEEYRKYENAQHEKFQRIIDMVDEIRSDFEINEQNYQRSNIDLF